MGRKENSAIGGRNSALNMTPEQRKARASKARAAMIAKRAAAGLPDPTFRVVAQPAAAPTTVHTPDIRLPRRGLLSGLWS